MSEAEGIIVFQRLPDYRLYSSTGVWGGINPQGLIICDFFLDQINHPKTVSFTVHDGTVIQGEEDSSHITITRELQVGIVLKPDIAYLIGQWLIEKAKEAGHNP